jgi:hypothetical protein
VHIYPSVLQAVPGRGYTGRLEGEHSGRIGVWLCRILDMDFGEFQLAEVSGAKTLDHLSLCTPSWAPEAASGGLALSGSSTVCEAILTPPASFCPRLAVLLYLARCSLPNLHAQ